MITFWLFPYKVKVKTISDRSEFERSYPCYAAVDRAAAKVPRHAGRVIWLEYEGNEGERAISQLPRLVSFLYRLIADLSFSWLGHFLL